MNAANAMERVEEEAYNVRVAKERDQSPVDIMAKSFIVALIAKEKAIFLSKHLQNCLKYRKIGSCSKKRERLDFGHSVKVATKSFLMFTDDDYAIAAGKKAIKPVESYPEVTRV